MKLYSLSLCAALLLAAAPLPAQTPPTTAPSLAPSPMLQNLLDASPAGGDVVAKYDTATLSREQLVDFVLRTRGLDAMLNLMQLKIAQTLARRENVTVTPGDVEAETRATLAAALQGQQGVEEANYPQLLDQLLTQRQLSRAEFDVVMATNAYLKALARPRVRAAMTDENLRKYFDIRYGAQVKVRHVQADNLATIAAAKKRVDDGEDFAKVAATMSNNNETKRLGGLLPPFGLNSQLPLAFKQAAFALEVGQVSGPVEADGTYHLIKLEEKIAPKAVKFEDVKEDLGKQLVEEQTQATMTQLRRTIEQALASGQLQVDDPMLAEQLKAKVAAIQPKPVSKEELSRQMEAERGGAATRPGE